MMKRLTALLTVLAIGVACDDDPTGNGSHEDPEGVEIRLGANVIVTVDGTQVTGTIEVNEGDETADYEFVFVDADGDEITLDEDFYLEVEVDDETVAEFHQHAPGEFEGHFEGLAAGSTTIEIRLMHGEVGSGHPDYISEPVTVNVN